MNKRDHLKFKSETGVTLVELLAAIAILSIIVMGFLGLFIQAGRTNSMTNEVNEATFIAQEEIEEVTEYAKNNTAILEWPSKNKNGYAITTEIKEVEDSNLYQVIVKVMEGDKLRAKMETRIPFAETNAQ